MTEGIDFGSLRVFDEADVVVCGGGTAGAYAAKAAADLGADVLIVEQTGCLGGSQTNGLVTPVMSTHIASNPRCSYVSREVGDRLTEIGGCADGYMNFDPLLMEIVLGEICEEAGVRVLYHTFIVDAQTENGRVTAIAVANKSGLGLIRGKMFIDCTGDADVCVRAGAGYTGGLGNSGKNQSVSLRYTVSGVDLESFSGQIAEEVERTGTDRVAKYYRGKLYLAVTKTGRWTFSDIFDRAIEAGDLDPGDKTYWQGFYISGRPGSIAFNNPEFPCDGDATDPAFQSRIQTEGKRHILRQLLFYRKYFRGFEKAYISKIASVVGVRESRNVVTDYVLTADDIFSRRKFDDMFCQTDYPVDVHGGMPDHPEPTCVDGKKWYEIPFRSLVVKGFDNLFVAGRCLGADFMAQSSVRVQQSARSSGEAAGLGAEFALARGCTSHEVDGKEIRKIMTEKGAEYVS